MSKLKHFLVNFEEFFGGICLVLMTLFVFLNTFSRLLFKFSIPALDELSYTLFAYVIFVGASALYKIYGHGVIDIIVKMFPKPVQAAFSYAITILLLVTNVFLLYLSTNYCIQSYARKTQTLHLPYSITSFALVLGFFFMSIHSIFLLKNVIVKKDYYHKIPIYDGIVTVDSVDDMVQDTMADQQKKKGKAGEKE